jgi:hypothetical protein
MVAKKKTPAKMAAKPAKKQPARKAPARAKPKAKPAAAHAAIKHAGGRPTDYRPEFADQAYGYTLLGATDARIAELFGVSESTLNLWKRAHPEFSESMQRGKERADAEIARSLYHRAKGYSHPEDDIRTCGAEIVITPTVKHYPPDTAAASLWLRNRQPKLWRDKVDLEHAGPNGGPIQSEAKVDVTLTPADAYLRMLGK